MATYTITDTFPAPVLDYDKWTDVIVGSSSMVVGTPTDGVYPVDVDDDGDAVVVDSENKIFVPANHDFEFILGYYDVYSDPAPPAIRTLFLGWRSILKGSGVPLWGVDVLLKVDSGPTYTFQKLTIVNSVVTLTDLITDPTSGADGQFKVERVGDDYKIYYYNSGWVLLDTITLGYKSTGFVQFGVYAGAITPPLTGFPWILQP